MGEWFDAGPVNDIEEPGARGFEQHGTGFFVVRKDGGVYAYRNRCPHTGAPLEWLPNEFLDLDKSFIECAMHGALFRPDNGLCLRGPCAGQSLTSLEARVENGRVLVAMASLRSDQA